MKNPVLTPMLGLRSQELGVKPGFLGPQPSPLILCWKHHCIKHIIIPVCLVASCLTQLLDSRLAAMLFSYIPEVVQGWEADIVHRTLFKQSKITVAHHVGLPIFTSVHVHVLSACVHLNY